MNFEEAGDLVDRIYAAGWEIKLQDDDPLPGMGRLFARHRVTGQDIETTVVTGPELTEALESLLSGDMEVRS